MSVKTDRLVFLSDHLSVYIDYYGFYMIKGKRTLTGQIVINICVASNRVIRE